LISPPQEKYIIMINTLKSFAKITQKLLLNIFVKESNEIIYFSDINQVKPESISTDNVIYLYR